jgi:hypothetical protein
MWNNRYIAIWSEKKDGYDIYVAPNLPTMTFGKYIPTGREVFIDGLYAEVYTLRAEQRAEPK